jgi:hypothetical protein
VLAEKDLHLTHDNSIVYSSNTDYIALRGKREIMKPATLVGILLIILGIVGFATGGISFTHEKKDVDLGPVQIQHKQKEMLPLSPVLSIIALVGGIGLVVVGSRSNRKFKTPLNAIIKVQQAFAMLRS